MHANDVATTLKLLNRDAAALLRARYSSITLARETPPRLRELYANSGLCMATDCWPGRDFVAHWGRPEPWRALSARKRWQLVAASGDRPSLDTALTHCRFALTEAVAVSAAAAGNVYGVERLLEVHCRWSNDVAAAAAHFGHTAVLQLLREQGMLCQMGRPRCWQELEGGLPGIMTEAACRVGHGHIIAWLEEQLGWRMTHHAAACARAAAGNGHVGLVEQLAPLLIDPRTRTRVLASVAYGCSLDYLQRYFQISLGNNPAAQMASREKAEVMACALGDACALGSPTADWAAKFDWLWSLWGPEPWRSEEAAGHGSMWQWHGSVWHLAAQHADFLARLQHLAACDLAPGPAACVTDMR
ncbi:hypothetical protein HYH02_007238 [Chlamydomonas schloesseri]|uniref:Uncharacterized protein n=1 Tax=Chlamydomonas schloesseri TaxID=2026947 RepID=A0A835WIJ1_9CHLO|nr:hypothetical protein HYH02_007238 [Chlamydomonas schloesseri]|eukprot:KAG2447781.1 hypothetical protein HYH02_007238 [Chlamydomonas schloesseri]